MFLKNLRIENKDQLIREINFLKGLNLIVDETITDSKKESGNNVGKTTVLRLIDFGLGSDGTNIYQDTEFKNSNNNTEIENFLKNNNIIITLTLKKDIEIFDSEEIVIKRNFLSYSDKIQEIDGINYSNDDFPKKLKELIFHSIESKPTFRQIVSKNIRDEKNKLTHTVKVLSPFAKKEEHEALYLFWLGINPETSERKIRIRTLKKIEENLQARLRKESSPSQIEQSLLVLEGTIQELTNRKENLNFSNNYEIEFAKLNEIRSKINKFSTELSQLELRKDLISESTSDLKNEISDINPIEVKKLYEEAKSLIPEIQRTFEETLQFHNKMTLMKMKYITHELPQLESEIIIMKSKINSFLSEERTLSDNLKSSPEFKELEILIVELNNCFEKKGKFEELKRLWQDSQSKIDSFDKELESINKGIDSKDELIKIRVADFNKYFSNISYKLYGEQFILSAEKGEKGYELAISSINGNLGTGKKKGQIAAFDLAYIQFADALGLECIHFILHDQIENVHKNQITSIFTDIVSHINCQYIVPVLRDKLPNEINVKQYEILSLSQNDKLFKLK